MRGRVATVGSMGDPFLLEHREHRLARRVRQNRFRIAVAIAAIEGILAVAGVMPWWLVILLAIAAVAVYAGWGREHGNADVRVLTWTAPAPVDRAPGWATRLHTDAAIRAGAHAARQAVHDGDRPGHGANPSLHQKED